MAQHQKDPKASFEASFLPEIKEKLFLVKKSMGHPSKAGAYCLNGTRVIAWVECGTGELHDGPGGIRCMYRPGLFVRKPDFSPLGVYRIRVRENRDRPTDHMIVKVLGKAEDPRLQAIAEEYRRPVTLETDLGTFELDRDYDEYRGETDWLGEKISVYLDVEEGKTDAERALRQLERICADPARFDADVRAYIAADETLWDWLEDGEYEREGFEQRIGLPSLMIGADGEAGVWFNGGDPFGGHSIVVSVDENGAFTGIDLVG